MNVKTWLHGWYARGLFRLAEGRVIHGVEVRILMPDVPYEDLFGKVELALDLLAEYAPQSLVWLRRYGRILVFGNPQGPPGEWHRNARVVRLSETYVARAKSQPAHVAATIVHETAHAWLEAHGVPYAPENRRRIEAICVRAEVRFAGRIPGGSELAMYYADSARRILAGSDEEWSDEAFRRGEKGRPRRVRAEERATRRGLEADDA